MRAATVKRRKRTHGFTLIEIVVVLMIIGSIASAVGISVMRHMRESRVRDTLVRARAIQHATKSFLMGNAGACPTVRELLDSGELDSTTDPHDAWGNDFTIECDADVIHVHSAGPDEQPGTEDDVGF